MLLPSNQAKLAGNWPSPIGKSSKNRGLSIARLPKYIHRQVMKQFLVAGCAHESLGQEVTVGGRISYNFLHFNPCNEGGMEFFRKRAPVAVA